MRNTSFFPALLLATLGACATAGGPDDLGEATVEIRLAATPIPSDGQCALITATRLADFHVTTYRGLLDGAVLKLQTGEHTVTASAYPPPCNQVPVAPPWAADQQIANFAPGSNVLVLNFKKKADVEIDANFEQDLLLVEQPGTRRRIGRNNEDITPSGLAGQTYAIDGWEVKLFDDPLSGGGGNASESVSFTTQVVGATPYSPRGMGRTPNGTFYFQVSDTFEPIARFDGGGLFSGSLPVIYPEGTIQWDNTDGLDAIDDTHLVRTGFLNVPINCDENNANCNQTGLDILELRNGPGGESFEVVNQILFTEQNHAPLNAEYPLAVVASGGGFALVTLPEGGDSRLVQLAGDGTILAQNTVAGSNEGLAIASDGRLLAMTYEGVVTAHDFVGVSPRLGETLSYVIQPNVTNVASFTWDSVGDRFVVLELDRRRTYFADASFSTASLTPIDLSGYTTVTAVEMHNGQLAVLDRLPPIEPNSGQRIPRVDHYNLDGTPGAQVLLAGGPLPVRPRSMAAIGSTGQIVVHHRRPGNPVDPTVDAVAFVHNGDGSLAYSFDLSPYGFTLIFMAKYLPLTNELAFKVLDLNGGVRLVITNLAGAPNRSYNIDLLPDGVGDMAPISSGPFAGEVGAVIGQPTFFFRLAPL